MPLRVCAVLCLVFIGVRLLVQLFHFKLDQVLFHFRDMSPKVDQISGAVFSVNNAQPSNSHSLSTHCICNTSSCNVNERQHTILHMVTCYVKKTSCFLMCSTFGDLP